MTVVIDGVIQGQDGGGGSSGPFAMSLRVLDDDVTIPDNYGAFVVGPLDMNGHTITFGTNTALAVL